MYVQLINNNELIGFKVHNMHRTRTSIAYCDSNTQVVLLQWNLASNPGFPSPRQKSVFTASLQLASINSLGIEPGDEASGTSDSGPSEIGTQ